MHRGKRRALFELRSGARFVCPAKASCAAVRWIHTTEGSRRLAHWGGFSLVTFFGRAKKVISCRAAPGEVAFDSAMVAKPPNISLSLYPFNQRILRILPVFCIGVVDEEYDDPFLAVF